MDEKTEERQKAAYAALRDECSALLHCLATGNHCTVVDEGKLEFYAVIELISYLQVAL